MDEALELTEVKNEPDEKNGFFKAPEVIRKLLNISEVSSVDIYDSLLTAGSWLIR